MKKIVSLIIAAIMLATLCTVFVTPIAADDAVVEEVMLYVDGQPCIPEGATSNVMSLDEAFAFVGTNTFGDVDATTTETYTIKLLKNATMGTQQLYVRPTCGSMNVIIDGKLADGSNALISSNCTTNNFKFSMTGKAIFKNVDIVSSPSGGCMIQLHNEGKADLDIIDCNITTRQELYGTINSMRADGGKVNINIVRSTIQQIEPKTTTIQNKKVVKDGAELGVNPLPTYTYVAQRGIVFTGNAGGNDHHLVLNIIDSDLKSYSSCVFVINGSTADIDVKNSTLEVLAHETAGRLTVSASGSTLKKYYWNLYDDADLNGVAAVQLDPVAKIAAPGATGTLRDGTYDTITFDATDTMIKYPTGGMAISQVVGYNGIDYSASAPRELLNQETYPTEVTITVNDIKTAELRAASKVTATFEQGEPDANVTTPFDEFDYPELLGASGGDTTTANPGGDTTTATPGGDTTTATPGGDTTTATPGGDTTTATPGGDTTTATPGDDTTTATPGGDTTTAPAAGDDVTTAPVEETAGGCAGCGGEGDPAVTTVAAIAIAMAAAVAIIVKKK